MNPTDYPAKKVWQSTERAAAYRQARHPGRYTRSAREDVIINGWLEDLGADSIVCDVPCGTGRLVRLITGRGLRYVGVDVSLAMIREAKREPVARAPVGFLNADAVRLPFPDRSVDCVILWRFLHHLPNSSMRQAILREAARITRDRVLLSFYHALSFTACRRRLERIFVARPEYGQAVTHWQLQREAGLCGLDAVEFRSFRKYVSINWFARLQKRR